MGSDLTIKQLIRANEKEFLTELQPDRYGDPDRNLVLYVGRRWWGMKLKALAAAVGLPNFGVAATAARRYERRLKNAADDQPNLQRVLRLLNCEM